MTSVEFNALLVPVDFSAASEAALHYALQLAGPEATVIMQHVVDPSLVALVVEHEFATADDAERRMRDQARSQLAALRDSVETTAEIDVLVSTGLPFLEILRKSEDFVVDAIVLGRVGARGAIEKLLFGSVAEKVLRGSKRPVIVLPLSD